MLSTVRHNIIGSGSRHSAGFTLVEVLVVLAITALLTGLLVKPLIDSFNITQQTQVAVRAQDAARLTLEQVTRETQSAVYVYDNSNLAITIPVDDTHTYDIPYARLDLVPPRLVMHCNSPFHPADEPRDYPRGNLAWPQCPASHSPNQGNDDVEARVISPVQPDGFVVRYFVGLIDPTRPYNNPMENRFALAGDAPNTFVLYRAEFSPYDENLIDSTGGANGLMRPDFFYNQNSAPNGRTFAENWKRVAQIVGPSNDVDLIIVRRDDSGNPIGVDSTVRFLPNKVSNDVLTPTEMGRQAEGEPDFPASVYRASRGQWGPDFQVRVFRENMSVIYYTQRDAANGHVYVYDTASSDPVFDITAWETTRQISPANPKFMFTVDPNRGQVSFAFPSTDLAPEEDDVWLPENINQQYADMYAADGVAIRQVVLNKFAALQADMPNVKIVPGSERVIGPNWTVGPDYGEPVQYTRVPYMEDPGPNQYRIDYRTGSVYFYSLPSPQMPERTMAGGASVAIQIRYHIQNNEGFGTQSGDLVSADYTSKNMLNAQVGYRIYDNRDKPQGMALSNNILVRNFHR